MRASVHGLSALSFAVLACLQACSDGPDSGGPLRPQLRGRAPGGMARAPQAGAGEYMPYGVPVPPGEPVRLSPEPYDPVKHGRLVPHTQPELNELHRAPGGRIRGGPVPEVGTLASPKSEYWFKILEGRGSYAVHDAQLDVRIDPAFNRDDSVYIYAPTQIGANGTCIEQSTAHFRNPRDTITHHYHGFFNWCQSPPGFIYFQDMENPTWRNKYLRFHVPGAEERYAASVYWTHAAWNDTTPKTIGLLYNWILGRWEEVTGPIVGTYPGRTHGWTAWESHHINETGECPDIPDIRSSDTRLYWYPRLTKPIGDVQNVANGRCWQVGEPPPWSMHLTGDGDDWEARTNRGGARVVDANEVR